MRSPRVEEVSDGVYAYIQPDGSWYINNTGFLVGGGGVISIDSCATQRRTRALLAAIASVTALPVRTLINTHHHGDHTYGNYLFGGATIVAHERCRGGVLASGLPANLGVWTDVDWGIPELAPPFLTYADAVTVWSGDLKCDVRYVGMPAHTTNDSLIWLPERSVLFAGDLAFSGGTPFLLMGSVEGAIEVLEPGHGPVSGPEVIDEMLGYLRFVLDVARNGMAAGLSPLDAARQADLGGYAGLLDSERIVGNLHRAYAELAGAPRGAEIDLIAALTDMISYNGGRPLTCHA